MYFTLDGPEAHPTITLLWDSRLGCPSAKVKCTLFIKHPNLYPKSRLPHSQRSKTRNRSATESGFDALRYRFSEMPSGYTHPTKTSCDLLTRSTMAKDLFHNAVKNALTQEGWIITGDPLTIRIDRVKLEIDLAAEKVLAAEKDGQKIAVEIKSFINPSAIYDFHAALGQFLSYRLALEMTEPDRDIFLAIPEDIFNGFFQERFVQFAIKTYSLQLLVYNPDLERIVQWKP